MYYVKVVNEIVVEGPNYLSSNVTDSPNVNWPKAQMDLWGYVIVDLNYDQSTEKLDLDNPIINQDGSVTYPKIQLTAEELAANVLAKLIRDFNPDACIIALYEEFKTRSTLTKEWAGLVVELIKHKNFADLKSFANANLTGDDLTDFKAVFLTFNIDLDDF
jgi:hypothetical protein